MERPELERGPFFEVDVDVVSGVELTTVRPRHPCVMFAIRIVTYFLELCVMDLHSFLY